MALLDSWWRHIRHDAGAEVPYFKVYWATVNDMDGQQVAFYRYLRNAILHGEYPNVQGNISYLFVYAYELLARWRQEGFETVYNLLLDIAEAYHYETKFAEGCRYWAYDCLLATEQYERYMTLTEPPDVFRGGVHEANLRCNVAAWLGQDADPVDLCRLTEIKPTSYTKKNQTAFRDFLRIAFAENASKNGPWLGRILAEQEQPAQRYRQVLLSGIGADDEADDCPIIETYCFYTSKKTSGEIKDVFRTAENLLREAHRLPRVGEGWISEAALYQAATVAFPETQVIQHGRPKWLGQQHFDIWLPRWNVAVEYQGAQHFEPIARFGGIEALVATQERDARKAALCRDFGVTLVLALPHMAHEEVIEQIRASRSTDVPDACIK